MNGTASVRVKVDEENVLHGRTLLTPLWVPIVEHQLHWWESIQFAHAFVIRAEEWPPPWLLLMHTDTVWRVVAVAPLFFNSSVTHVLHGFATMVRDRRRWKLEKKDANRNYIMATRDSPRLGQGRVSGSKKSKALGVKALGLGANTGARGGDDDGGAKWDAKQQGGGVGAASQSFQIFLPVQECRLRKDSRVSVLVQLGSRHNIQILVSVD
ncbi:hypothetical protein B0H14DRAFT_3134533 [Mycena olivaceomarginata]|nr:hypothetical protein B0H14DRAFT_3134533 [Mycena olivaceomarginata]